MRWRFRKDENPSLELSSYGKGWEDGYSRGEIERHALATQNSNLRSDLLAAQQQLDDLRANMAQRMAELNKIAARRDARATPPERNLGPLQP